MMFNTLRYPTKQQNLIWLRRRQKDRPTDIANDLQVSRPFVTMEQKRAEGRIKKLIEHAASVDRVKIQRLSARYGIAEGFCHAYNSQVYIVYSPKMGIHNWFVHQGNCGACDLLDECKEILRTLAEEWEIGIPPEMPPTELGVYLFETIRRRLKWN
jgi:hypothetical protein